MPFGYCFVVPEKIPFKGFLKPFKGFFKATVFFLRPEAFFLIVFLHRQEEVFGIGVILLIVPFIALIAANFFIKKDENLVRSSERVR